jgi:hypothetical protein
VREVTTEWTDRSNRALYELLRRTRSESYDFVGS